MLGACASGSQQAPRERSVGRVQVSVGAWNSARVSAVLVDGEGRRTGWLNGRPIREIRGCIHEYGSEEGLPLEGAVAPPGEGAVTPEEHPGGPESDTPKYHHFTVEDSAGNPGLVRLGRCELRLDPAVGGKVHLILIAAGEGISECRDTVSVRVTPRVGARWWLTWQVSGHRCIARISPVAADHVPRSKKGNSKGKVVSPPQRTTAPRGGTPAGPRVGSRSVATVQHCVRTSPDYS